MSEASAPPSVPLDSLVAQLADEFTARQKRGEQPDIEDYAARHPEHAAVIRNVLAAASRACELPKLDAVFAKTGISQSLGRATIAWLLKYGLLVRVPAVTVGDGTGRR